MSVGPGPCHSRRRRGDAVIGADGEESLSAFWFSGIGHGDGAGGGRGCEDALVAYGVGAQQTRRRWEIKRITYSLELYTCFLLRIFKKVCLIHEAGQGTVGSEALVAISSPWLIFVKC